MEKEANKRFIAFSCVWLLLYVLAVMLFLGFLTVITFGIFWIIIRSDPMFFSIAQFPVTVFMFWGAGFFGLKSVKKRCPGIGNTASLKMTTTIFYGILAGLGFVMSVSMLLEPEGFLNDIFARWGQEDSYFPLATVITYTVAALLMIPYCRMKINKLYSKGAINNNVQTHNPSNARIVSVPKSIPTAAVQAESPDKARTVCVPKPIPMTAVQAEKSANSKFVIFIILWLVIWYLTLKLIDVVLYTAVLSVFFLPVIAFSVAEFHWLFGILKCILTVFAVWGAGFFGLKSVKRRFPTPINTDSLKNTATIAYVVFSVLAALKAIISAVAYYVLWKTGEIKTTDFLLDVVAADFLAVGMGVAMIPICRRKISKLYNSHI